MTNILKFPSFKKEKPTVKPNVKKIKQAIEKIKHCEEMETLIEELDKDDGNKAWESEGCHYHEGIAYKITIEIIN